MIIQDGQVREAAKACASFAYHNPRNMHIKANMKFYSGQPKVTEEDQKPLEPKVYVSPKIPDSFVENSTYSSSSCPYFSPPLFSVQHLKAGRGIRIFYVYIAAYCENIMLCVSFTLL